MKISLTSNSGFYVYNFMRHLIQDFISKGYYIDVITPEDQYSPLLEKLGCRHHKIYLKRRSKNVLDDLILMIQYFFILKKIKPNYLFTYTIKPNIYGSLIARLLGITTVNNITGLGTVFIYPGFLSIFVSFLYKISFYGSKCIFFQNQQDFNYFKDNNLVNSDKAYLIEGMGGIDTNHFKYIKPIDKKDSMVFLLIARIIKDKGIIEYIEAAKLIKAINKNINFQILGELDQSTKVSAIDTDYFEESKKNIIEHIGWKQDVREYINNSDCIVLPSYREGTSKSLLESASMGRPIIASDVPGCNNVVKDGYNGYLCKPKDVSSLKKSINNMLLLSYDERVKMGINGRNTVISKYGVNIVNKKIFTILNLN